MEKLTQDGSLHSVHDPAQLLAWQLVLQQPPWAQRPSQSLQVLAASPLLTSAGPPGPSLTAQLWLCTAPAPWPVTQGAGGMGRTCTPLGPWEGQPVCDLPLTNHSALLAKGL